MIALDDSIRALTTDLIAAGGKVNDPVYDDTGIFHLEFQVRKRPLIGS